MHQKNDHHPQRTDERLLSNRQLTRNTVAFCISGKGKAKSHGCPWLKRSIPAILYKTLRDFVRRVRNNYVREHFLFICNFKCTLHQANFT
jgi:hypothetical protein